MAAPRGNPSARGAIVLVTVPPARNAKMHISREICTSPERCRRGQGASEDFAPFLGTRRSFKKTICASVRRRKCIKGLSGRNSDGIRQSVSGFSIGACCRKGFKFKPNSCMPAAIASRASGATNATSKIEPPCPPSCAIHGTGSTPRQADSALEFFGGVHKYRSLWRYLDRRVT